MSELDKLLRVIRVVLVLCLIGPVVFWIVVFLFMLITRIM